MLIIAATGHRPPKLGGYGQEALDRLCEFAKAYLRKARPGATISGMALGWDQAFATASVSLGIPYVAAVPFIGQEAAWSGGQREDYRRLLAMAARVRIVCNGGYAPWKMQTRNQWMVDKATRLAALWDGSPGGTANCVSYATAAEKPIDRLWDRWLTWP